MLHRRIQPDRNDPRSRAKLVQFLFVCSFIGLSTLAFAEDGFQALFNGEDLSGWQRVNTDETTWVVRDGMLICSGKPIGELRTTKMYQNFVLELEWRHLIPGGNAGIFVWADDLPAPGQPFHRGIEVQVLENAYGNNDKHTTHGDIFPIHGATMTPLTGRGSSRAFPTEHRSLPSPQWNHYRIEAVDGAISLAVNGKVVTQGKDCQPRKGYLCLESEGGVVHYRNLKIKELPGEELDPTLVATADRGYRCLYTGVDLQDWQIGPADGWRPNDWRLTYDGDQTGAVAALQTRELFRDFSFILDFRLQADSGTPIIDLGAPRGRLVIDVDDSPWTQGLLPPGRWNRLAGQLVGSQFKATLNGHDLIDVEGLDPARSAAPIRIVPDGPLELANLFVRSPGPSPR